MEAEPYSFSPGSHLPGRLLIPQIVPLRGEGVRGIISFFPFAPRTSSTCIHTRDIYSDTCIYLTPFIHRARRSSSPLATNNNHCKYRHRPQQETKRCCFKRLPSSHLPSMDPQTLILHQHPPEDPASLLLSPIRRHHLRTITCISMVVPMHSQLHGLYKLCLPFFSSLCLAGRGRHPPWAAARLLLGGIGQGKRGG